MSNLIEYSKLRRALVYIYDLSHHGQPYGYRASDMNIGHLSGSAG